MFEDCVSLVNVDISGIVTPDSVDAGDLFYGCASLASIKVPDSLKVSCACGMFEDCSKLKTADLSGLVTDGAVCASRMFSDCLLLESVTMPETLRVSSASSMFSSCSSLKSIDTTGLDTSAATSLYSMFRGCSKLASLDVSGFDTSSVTGMSCMFSGCSKLAFLDVSGFDTSKVTDFCDMFQSCEKLESLDLSSFDTSNALYISYMFGGSFPTTIKLGDKFTFNGAYSERKLDFPTVNSWPSIYTGKWISSADGKVYAANEIPNNVAATYTAQKAVTAQLFTVDTADEVCSGAPITKKVTSEKLVEGRDYEVVYANNTAPGKATIAINGVGDLGGSVEYNFDIYPANYTWSTSDGAQDISTTINYKAKVEWKSSNDSVVTIGEASTSTTELGPIVSQKCSVKVTPKAVGTAFVYAYANGMQVAKVAVQVVAGAGKSIAGAQIGGVPASCTYNGEKVEPKVTVTLDGKRLTEGADYTVLYGANTDAGTGSVTVTGTGGYTGSASASFTIKQAAISGARVSAADQAWTGKALTPAPTVVWNGRTLAENTDYTVSYASNVDAGTATVTVAGKGNFAGTATGTFKITKPEPGKTDISGAEVTAAAQAYTGSALTPAVTVTLGGKALSAGTDYTVAYSSNVNAGTATVTVTGKGNYTGVATGTFKIAAIDASKASVKAADQAWTGEALTPAPTVTLGGKTLKQGTDYTAVYANNVNAGTATVTVTFKGNYSGTAKGTFKITKKDSGSDQPAASKVTMYRLYNKYTGEHFYTADAEEKDHLVKVGWNDEGVGWTAPSSSATPVYRLYNKYVPGGDHHYTTSKSERDTCVAKGWTYEGIGWYSDDAKGTPLYRQYNPYAKTGTHNYTTDKKENDYLVSLGWKPEGISWYGVK
ncbi:BspA family leucine-rich repeat surface protein [Paratractidigestivibacter sp.]|uniref:BspA family leucine-rich repeat surface protein n=1 Tax=Paratractidigestivibacter sp. TaxID=2847316 RepID=UPI002ACB15AB|nr:BspA family leucine-rich repeat surface protein [Paratractidigestivibacter sp.]